MARITQQQRLIEALIATGRAAAAPTLAYNLANFMRTMALPQEVKHWSLTTLRDKLVRSAPIVRHGRYMTFQLAEVAVPRMLFAEILRLIGGLRPKPVPT